MGLKSSRVFLSVLFAVVLAFSTALTIATSVLNSTILDNGFYAKHAITDEIVAEAEKQLQAKYEALEAECGIPARVFTVNPADTDLKSTMKQAIGAIFSEENEQLYSADRIERYYRLCTEYLEANNINYDENDVMRTAEKATKIYSETVGVQNSQAIQKYLTTNSSKALKINSVGLVGMAVSAILIALLYRKIKKAYQYISAGLLGGGLATVIGSLLCIITGVGKHFAVEPLIYQASLATMVKISFSLMLAGGLIVVGITALSVYFTQRNNKDRDESLIKIAIRSLFTKN